MSVGHSFKRTHTAKSEAARRATAVSQHFTPAVPSLLPADMELYHLMQRYSLLEFLQLLDLFLNNPLWQIQKRSTDKPFLMGPVSFTEY